MHGMWAISAHSLNGMGIRLVTRAALAIARGSTRSVDVLQIRINPDDVPGPSLDCWHYFPDVSL
jgi:hypothetical protein